MKTHPSPERKNIPPASRSGMAGAGFCVVPVFAMVMVLVFHAWEMNRQGSSKRAMPMGFYFKSGQWLADAHTLAGAVSYFFAPEAPRSGQQRAVGSSLAATNVASWRVRARAGGSASNASAPALFSLSATGICCMPSNRYSGPIAEPVSPGT
jgi:hypothetical protein